MNPFTPLRAPRVYASGTWWSSEQIEAIASGWRAAIDGRLDDEASPCAAALPPTPDGVALFVAVSSRVGPFLVLSDDPRLWPADAPQLKGLTLMLPPALAMHADLAVSRQFVPFVLPGPVREAGPRVRVVPCRAAGAAVMTSGSTGAPKPVYRPMDRLVASAVARADALGLRRGEGVICGVPFSSGQGLGQMITAMAFGGALGILGPVDHRQALAVIGRPEFSCWRATPHLADALGRCQLSGPAVAPRICMVSSPVPQRVFDAFLARYGVPLRQGYSSTETGAIAVDGGPTSAVVPGTVGFPLPGVEVRIGDQPDVVTQPGEVGRIWVRSPWQMAGYGLPPHVEPPVEVNGFRPTGDLGSRDESGRLTLAGRMDDNIRTRDGRLVNLAAVAGHLRSMSHVRAAVVLRQEGRSGAAFGAVLECESGESPASLHARAASTVPAWALPRTIVVVEEMPRLPTGKPDLLACRRLLAGERQTV